MILLFKIIIIWCIISVIFVSGMWCASLLDANKLDKDEYNYINKKNRGTD